MEIGDKLADGKPHDGRAPDYDDWHSFYNLAAMHQNAPQKALQQHHSVHPGCLADVLRPDAL